MSPVLALAARTTVVAVFALAVAGKLRSYQAFGEFRSTLDRIGWLPARLRAAAAIAIIAVEAACAVVILIPVTSRAGLLLAIAVLMMFTASAAWAMRGGRRLQCRCFGSDGGEMGTSHLVRNGLLLSIATLAATMSDDATPAMSTNTALAFLGGLALAFAFSHWNHLAYVFQPSR